METNKSGERFIAEVVYPFSKEKLWAALTETKAVQQWYFPQLIKFEPTVGAKFEFRNDGSPYQKDWAVTKVEHGRMLAHSWTYRGYTGMSEVTFELFAEGNETRLKLTHTGLDSFPDDPHFAPRRFADGWNQILNSNLATYLSRSGNK